MMAPAGPGSHKKEATGEGIKAMSTVLAVVGSPRRNGNTHTLVSRIADGAKSAGAEIDELFLGDFKIAECDGCHNCWKGRRCSKPDDMQDIYARIAASDAIIFGTPVYWYAPTGLMKMFVDRFVYFNCPANRKKIRNKKAVIAVPFEETDPATARLVEEFFRRSLSYLQMELLGGILAPGVGQKGQILDRTECLDRAYALGKQLV